MKSFLKMILDNILSKPLYMNSVYIFIASLLGSVAGFFFWMLASRLYPPSEVGIASSVVSSLNLVMMISLVGLNTSLVRFYPEYKEQAVVTTLLIVPFFGVIVSATYLMILTKISKNMKILFLSNKTLIILFVILSVLGALYRIFETDLIVTKRGRDYITQSLLLGSRVMFLPLFTSFGLVGIICSFGGGLTLGVLYSCFLICPSLFLQSSTRLYTKPSKEYLSAAFKFSVGNYIASILSMTPNQLMPTLILSYLGSTYAAYYYITTTIGSAILLFPIALNTSFFVEGSYGENTKELLKKVISTSFIYLAPVSVIIWFFGGKILSFFGKGYIEGLDLLRVIVVSGFPSVLLNFYVTLFNLKKQVQYVIMIMFFRLMLYLGLSYGLMSEYKILGVGYAWLVTNTVLVCIITIFLLHAESMHKDS